MISPRSQADLDRIVDLAGIDSFPASDPPGWWSGLTATPQSQPDEAKVLADEP
jgi:hypothetical protein